MKDKQLADLGHGIYLGNWESCLVMPEVKAIHISGTEPSLCGCPEDQKMTWVESEPFSIAQMEYVKEILDKNNEVLIHCQAGMNRAPTTCFLALLLRGVSVQEAYLSISKATLLEYVISTIPYWQPMNLRRIMLWVEKQKVS